MRSNTYLCVESTIPTKAQPKSLLDNDIKSLQDITYQDSLKPNQDVTDMKYFFSTEQY